MVGKVKLEIEEQLGDYLTGPSQIGLPCELKQPHCKLKR